MNRIDWVNDLRFWRWRDMGRMDSGANIERVFCTWIEEREKDDNKYNQIKKVI